MAKKTEPVAVKTTKVKIVFQGSSATVIRDNLPSIMDKAENSVEWLAKKGYKIEEIEVVGDKPSCWDVIFPPKTKSPEELAVAI
jgi:hypothetical protein